MSLFIPILALSIFVPYIRAEELANSRKQVIFAETNGELELRLERNESDGESLFQLCVSSLQLDEGDVQFLQNPLRLEFSGQGRAREEKTLPIPQGSPFKSVSIKPLDRMSKVILELTEDEPLRYSVAPSTSGVCLNISKSGGSGQAAAAESIPSEEEEAGKASPIRPVSAGTVPASATGGSKEGIVTKALDLAENVVKKATGTTDRQDLQMFESQVESIPSSQRTGAGGEEMLPDTTVFDLYLSDQPIGMILAAFTEEWFEVENPKDIVEQLHDRLTGGQAALERLFSDRIPGKRNEEGLGGIEYDLDTFRIIVMVDPKYLRVGGVSRSRLLPDPESQFALQQAVRVATAGEVSRLFETSALTHRTLASYGKPFLRAEGSFVQNTGNIFGNIPGSSTDVDGQETGKQSKYYLTELSGGTYWGPVKQDLGLLRSGASPLVGSVEYAGTRFENTEQLLVDQDLVRGSNFQIYVPSHSRVDFYQGGRLLSSQILNAGLQEIDTRSFPQGSYEVEIVINEDNGNVRRERQFFAKSGLLTVSSFPIITVEGGNIREDTDVMGRPVGHAGMRWRAASFLELDPAVFASRESVIGSLNAAAVVGETTVTGAYAQATNGTSGVSGGVSMHVPYIDVNWSLGGMKTFGSDDEDLITTGSNQFPQELQIPPGLSSWYGRVEKSFGDFSIYYAGNRNNSRPVQREPFVFPDIPPAFEEKKSTYAYGPGFEWRILNTTKDWVTLRVSQLRTDEGSGYQAYLNYNRRLGERWTAGTDLESNTANKPSSQRAGVSLGFNGRDSGGRGLSANMRESVRYERGPGTSDTSANTRTNRGTAALGTVTANYLKELYRVGGYLYDQRQREGSGTSLSLDAESSMVYSGGDVSVSYGSGIDSAVLVEVKSGTGLEGNFDVLVDGNVRGSAPVGRSVIIALSPFHTYSIALRQSQKDKELAVYDADRYDITLFPGNVVRKTWNADKVTIVIGRLVDDRGDPIRYQRIRGVKEYTITEQDGSFQLETSGLEQLYVQSPSRNCRIKLPKIKTDEYVFNAGDVVCEATEGALAPAVRTDLTLEKISKKSFS